MRKHQYVTTWNENRLQHFLLYVILIDTVLYNRPGRHFAGGAKHTKQINLKD